MAPELTRVPDWPLRLEREIEAARSRPFAWGTHDCATWSFSVVSKLRDTPPPPWIGRYRTRIGALRVMRKHGIGTLPELADAILGDALDYVLTAQRGDLVIVHGAFGICVGRNAAIMGTWDGGQGLAFVPMEAASLAWRV